MNTCRKQTTLAVVKAKSGKIYIGTNHCDNPQEKCPREGMETGQGYELCREICQQTGHAEANAIKKAGDDAKGATLFLLGHSYCCDDCMKAMSKAGIIDINIIEGVIQ